MYLGLLKRILDIILALLLLPIVILVVTIFGPIIYFSDPGSIFYNADRLGQNGKVFKMFKLRSMKLNSKDIRNQDGSTFSSENDPRLLTIGKFIRKSSIDEIPQILNVLIGDMSFVGPRPDLPEHISSYDKVEIKKISVKPGITGYNQAYYRNNIPWKMRLKNDVYYVENVNFIFDVKIIIKTFFTVIKKESVFNEE